MTKTIAIFATTLITIIVLMNLQTASAQEWRALTDKHIFNMDRSTQMLQKGSAEENDWLTTKPPLLKNTPVPRSNPHDHQLRAPHFENPGSRVGSWAPLQSAPGKENFTLFSF